MSQEIEAFAIRTDGGIEFTIYECPGWVSRVTSSTGAESQELAKWNISLWIASELGVAEQDLDFTTFRFVGKTWSTGRVAACIVDNFHPQGPFTVNGERWVENFPVPVPEDPSTSSAVLSRVTWQLPEGQRNAGLPAVEYLLLDFGKSFQVVGRLGDEGEFVESLDATDQESAIRMFQEEWTERAQVDVLTKYYESVGLNRDDAELLASHLITPDIAGIDPRGVIPFVTAAEFHGLDDVADRIRDAGGSEAAWQEWADEEEWGDN